MRIAHVLFGRCNPDSANGVDKVVYQAFHQYLVTEIEEMNGQPWGSNAVEDYRRVLEIEDS